jgi:hypothetical protein
VVFSGIVILLMRAYPAGLAGLISALWRRRPGGKSFRGGGQAES